MAEEEVDQISRFVVVYVFLVLYEDGFGYFRHALREIFQFCQLLSVEDLCPGHDVNGESREEIAEDHVVDVDSPTKVEVVFWKPFAADVLVEDVGTSEQDVRSGIYCLVFNGREYFGKHIKFGHDKTIHPSSIQRGYSRVHESISQFPSRFLLFRPIT